MGTKKKVKKLTATNEELGQSLSTLKGQLTKTETKLDRAEQKAARWKKEATAARTAAARSDARAEKLQRKLDRAKADLEPARAADPATTAASGRPAGESVAADGLTVPDASWTVAQLRAEVRARGLTGLSSKPKAELLRALTREP